ncbi:zinc finger and BTB domain-containing protein 17-like [Denticeps clupeoides]|uniref:C2H2-type domain-containing protein n=1 Tax=Denticeps clupeoides TaxID=299321 RepID=A0AAY4AG06_9TELE|nr:zinc finger and BTB domain-containing protein 17-like [Denticeps clupeoides]
MFDRSGVLADTSLPFPSPRVGGLATAHGTPSRAQGDAPPPREGPMAAERDPRKKRSDRARPKCRVDIGEALQRWRDVRESKGMKRDEEVAAFLLDSQLRRNEVIVSEKCLLQLFEWCLKCGAQSSIVVLYRGRLLTVTQQCNDCSYHRQWRSHKVEAEKRIKKVVAEEEVTLSFGDSSTDLSDEGELCDEDEDELCDEDEADPCVENEQELYSEGEDKTVLPKEEREVEEQRWRELQCGDAVEQSLTNSAEEEVRSEEVVVKLENQSPSHSAFSGHSNGFVLRTKDQEDEMHPSESDLSGTHKEDGRVSPALPKTSVQSPSEEKEIEEPEMRGAEEDGGEGEAEEDGKSAKCKYQDSSDELESDARVKTPKACAAKGTCKSLVWCTDCDSKSSYGCTKQRHAQAYGCVYCGAGGEADARGVERSAVRFGDLNGFLTHAWKAHGLTRFCELCPDCGKFVTKVNKLKYGMAHICKDKIGLYKRKHSHMCKYCRRPFQVRAEKVDHEKSHDGEELPYSCPGCPRRFHDIHSRNNHSRSHSDPRKYVCTVCNKGFAILNRLERHKLIHSGQKPYACEVCQHSFNQPGHLKSHMRVHTGERPFLCHHCGKCFNHNVSLKNHIQRYHWIPVDP